MKTTIIVNYDAGWGNRLTIRGAAPLSWESGRPMKAMGTSTWQLELDLDEPLDFKPSLNDEVWAFGRRNYRVEPGEVARIYPHFFSKPGWADAIGYIPFKGRDLNVRLYTPPGYQENAERRYPVVYCLDGQTLFEPRLENGDARDWHLDQHLNVLIESRQIEPLMVVGIDFVDRGQPDQDPHGAGAGGKAREFASLVLKLKETIDRTYQTRSDAENTGILGSSPGGLFALWMGRHHPGVFGRVAAMSPSFWWADENMLAEVEVDKHHDAQMIYLDSGTAGDHEETASKVWKVAETLKADGWVEGEDLRCEVFEFSEHKPAEWGRRVGVPLQFLFPWSGR